MGVATDWILFLVFKLFVRMNTEKPKKKLVKVYEDIIDVYKAIAINQGIKDYGLIINQILYDRLEKYKDENDPLITKTIKNKIHDVMVYECDKDIKRVSQKIRFKIIAKKSLLVKLNDCVDKEEYIEYLDMINLKAIKLEDKYVKKMVDHIKKEVGFCKTYREVRQKTIRLLGGKKENEFLPPPGWTKGQE
jgi:hypothetical protein